MSIISEGRLSDSPYVETVTRGQITGPAFSTRPAEYCWHMILTKPHDRIQALVVGPWATSGTVALPGEAEVLWIKFKLGTFMPHLPTRKLINAETALPGTTRTSFWLNGYSWQFPDYENADTFIDRLAHEGLLVSDPIVTAALQDQPLKTPARTIRHRFLQATGLTQSYIRQMQRANHAQALLQQGTSILDTVEEAGYFDQPHLTRSLKQFTGYTPAQIIRMSLPFHTRP